MLSLLRRFRRILVPTALGSYGMPVAVALAADVGHSAEHWVATALRYQRSATAMGWSHPAGVEPASPEGADLLIHTHDGSTHAHRDVVAVLIDAAEGTDEPSSEGRSPAPAVGPHVAPATSGFDRARAVRSSRILATLRAGWISPAEPVPPPPRV